MAQHPTAGLSFGDPPPTYDYVDGDNCFPNILSVMIQNRTKVHVSTEEQARDVLRSIGMGENEIDHRMRVADGSWAHEQLQAGVPDGC